MDRSQPAEFRLPTWPQEFVVSGSDHVALGFPVTQPGAVLVEVDWEGPDIVAELTGPMPQTARQIGARHLRLSHQVTPQESRQGIRWLVTLKLAKPAAVSARGRIDVRTPDVDTQIARTRSQTELKLPTIAEPAVRSRGLGSAELTGARMTAMPQRAVAQAIAPPAAGRTETAVQTAPIGPAPAPFVPPACQAPSNPGQQPGAVLLNVTGYHVDNSPDPAPRRELVMDDGRIVLHGAGLPPGDVHFIVGGQQKTAPALQYSPTSIATVVPSGIDFAKPTDGYVYVGSPVAASNSICLTFLPKFEVRTVKFVELCFGLVGPGNRPMRPQCRVGQPWGSLRGDVQHQTLGFWGFRGDDEFFPAIALKPSFRVLDIGAFLDFASGSNGNAQVAEKRLGSAPYFKIHWWIDPGGSTQYGLSVALEGPKGVTPYMQ